VSDVPKGQTPEERARKCPCACCAANHCHCRSDHAEHEWCDCSFCVAGGDLAERAQAAWWMTTSQPNGQAPCDVQWGGVEDAWLAGYVTGATDLLAEVDRLRHGEKVRDGMLRRIIHREHRQVGWVVSGDEWWSLEPADGTFVEVREPLTPDEIAVLAALDTEEGGEQ
jgi:hypothetical protein